MIRRHSPFVGLVAMLATTFVGCQTFHPDWSKNWFGSEAPKVQNSKFAAPVKLAIMWTPAVMNTPGRKPTRGFGGRIYFYDAANHAIPVEGQLVVYGYDNARQDPHSKTPDRKFVFTPEQFTGHYSPTQLGASYSVWVPWDEVGNPQLEISLVPIFTSTSGALVVAEGSKSLLPGPTTENSGPHYNHSTLSVQEMVPRQIPGGTGVRPVSYLEPPVPGDPTTARKYSELTINMPGSMSDRLARAEPNPLNQLIANQPPPGQPAGAPYASAARAPVERREVPPPWSPLNQPSARFLRPIPRAPASPGLPPIAGLLPTQPSREAQPFYPLGSPPGNPQSEPRATW